MILSLRRYFRSQFLLIATALLTQSLPLRAQTWTQWPASAGGNDHYYALTPAATNWEAAETLAVSWGGTLATITSSNEQEFVNRTFLTGPLEKRPVWIGLKSSGARGPFKINLGVFKIEGNGSPKHTFFWVTGEPLEYTNWHSGQPDNFPPGENYGTINWHYSDDRGAKGDWNDAPEAGTTGFSGTTSGPYFGIVERDYDPRLPVRPPPIVSKNTFHLILIAAVGLILLIVFVRSRRGKKSKMK
jgi:hypothetical protein